MKSTIKKIIDGNIEFYSIFNSARASFVLTRIFYFSFFIVYLFSDLIRFDFIQKDLLSFPYSQIYGYFGGTFVFPFYFVMMVSALFAIFRPEVYWPRFLVFVTALYLFYLRISFNCLYHFENVLIINLFLFCFVDNRRKSMIENNSLLYFGMHFGLINMYFFAALSKIRISGLSFISDQVPIEALILNEYWKYGHTHFWSQNLEYLKNLNLLNSFGWLVSSIVLIAEIIAVLFFFSRRLKKFIIINIFVLQLGFILFLNLNGFWSILVSYTLFIPIFLKKRFFDSQNVKTI